MHGSEENAYVMRAIMRVTVVAEQVRSLLIDIYASIYNIDIDIDRRIDI